MTYRELADLIENMTDEQKDQDVTVFVAEQNEYYPLVKDFPVCQSDGDVLEEGHYYLTI